VINLIKFGMYKRFGKKIFDIMLAAMLLIVLFPLLAVISLLIFIETKKSPIFIQERGLTLTKFRFKIYKFRTFYEDVLSYNYTDGKHLLHKPHLVKFITPIGKFLRKTGLDELPQLVNVLKGEMCFIGPRPLSILDLQLIEKNYPALLSERETINAKPGISGLWQTKKDEELSVAHLVEMDKFYAEEKSFLLDFYLILRTVSVFFFDKHRDAVIGKTVLRYSIKNPLVNFKIVNVVILIFLLISWILAFDL